jgi:hypothetical protein
MFSTIVEIAATIGASLFFFPIIILGLLSLCVLSENCYRYSAVPAIVITGILLIVICGRYPAVYTTACSSPWLVLVAVAIYLVIGCTWARFKWYLRLKKARTSFLEVKERFISEKKLAADFLKPENFRTDDVSKELYVEFGELVGTKFGITFDPDDCGDITTVVNRIQPRIDKYKTEVMLWISYWPASMLWFAVYDMIKEVAEALYRAVRLNFQRMSDKMFADIV